MALTMKKDHLAGIISIIIAVQILPFSDISSKYLSLYLPILQVIWGRFFFHAFFTGIYAWKKHGIQALNPKLSHILLLRGAALFLAVGLLYATIKRIPLTTGLTLWFIEPFVLTFMCAIILKEKIHKVQWAAIIIGFIGVVIAIKPTVAPFDIAYVTGLLSGFFYAVFLFLTNYIDKNTPQIVSVFHTGLIGAVCSTFIVIPVWQTPVPFEWGLLIFSGIVAAVAHIFIVKSFAKTDASVIAPYTYSEIIMAAILGYLVFSDYPDIYLIVGAVMIVIGGVIVGKYKVAS